MKPNTTKVTKNNAIRIINITITKTIKKYITDQIMNDFLSINKL